MRRVRYVTGTRADWGLMASVLHRLRNRADIDLGIVVTGAHLNPRFGDGAGAIEREGYKVVASVPSPSDGSTISQQAHVVASVTAELIDVLDVDQPDLVVVLGDRSEAFGAAIAVLHSRARLVHLHGGDRSSTVDDTVRHAITKLADLHLVATETSWARVVAMGEEPERVRVVGAPAISSIADVPVMARLDVARALGIGGLEDYVLLTMHPETAVQTSAEAAASMRVVLQALRGKPLRVVASYPNTDGGGAAMADLLDEACARGDVVATRTLGFGLHVNAMRYARAMVGNSSSGIIEAPTLRLPVVNVGSRQAGRERAGNVLDVDVDVKAIDAAVDRCVGDSDFRASVNQAISPYGDAGAADRIVDVVTTENLDKLQRPKPLAI